MSHHTLYRLFSLKETLLLANFAVTLFMFGVIWLVQLVVYPQFLHIAATDFAEYHRQHTTRMGLLVALPMVIELITSAGLALRPPTADTRLLFVIGFLFALLTWIVTFFISIPLHDRLAQGHDTAACRALIDTNWLRTVLWTAHALTVLEIIRLLISNAIATHR